MRLAESVQKTIVARLEEILPRLGRLAGKNRETSRSPAELVDFQECYSAAIHLGNTVYGPESPQIRELLRVIEGVQQLNRHPGMMDAKLAYILSGFLANLRHEICAGLLIRIAEKAMAEILSDFLFLGDQAVVAGQKDVAAVLAAASLEDSLKRKAAELGLSVEDSDLSEVVNALKHKGFFQGAEAKIVSSFVGLRNRAMHAQWDKISGPDVASLIAYLKTFLTQKV